MKDSLDSKTKSRLVEIADGMYVERDVLGVVQAVQEYDENLRIKIAVDPGPGDPPYKLVEHCRDGIERVVFDLWELDARVLERVRAADNARGSVLQTVDGKNIDFKRVMLQRYRETIDEAHDIVKTFMRSRSKSKWTVKDGDRLVTIEDR